MACSDGAFGSNLSETLSAVPPAFSPIRTPCPLPSFIQPRPLTCECLPALLHARTCSGRYPLQTGAVRIGMQYSILKNNTCQSGEYPSSALGLRSARLHPAAAMARAITKCRSSCTRAWYHGCQQVLFNGLPDHCGNARRTSSALKARPPRGFPKPDWGSHYAV